MQTFRTIPGLATLLRSTFLSLVLGGSILAAATIFPDGQEIGVGSCVYTTTNCTVNSFPNIPDTNNISVVGLSFHTDISGSTITFGSDNRYIIGDNDYFYVVDWFNDLPDFTDVQITSNTIEGLNASAISFDANDIWVNLAGTAADPHGGPYGYVTLTVDSAPEPSTFGSLGLALAGLLGVFKRRKA